MGVNTKMSRYPRHVKTEAISYHNVTLNVSLLRCHGNDNNVSGC